MAAVCGAAGPYVVVGRRALPGPLPHPFPQLPSGSPCRLWRPASRIFLCRCGLVLLAASLLAYPSVASASWPATYADGGRWSQRA